MLFHYRLKHKNEGDLRREATAACGPNTRDESQHQDRDCEVGRTVGHHEKAIQRLLCTVCVAAKEPQETVQNQAQTKDKS